MARVLRLALWGLLVAFTGLAVAASSCRTFASGGVSSCGSATAPNCTNVGSAGGIVQSDQPMPTAGAGIYFSADEAAVAAVPGGVSQGCNLAQIGPSYGWYTCEVKTSTTYSRVRIIITEWATCSAASCAEKAGKPAGRMNHDTSVKSTSPNPGLSTKRYACVPISGTTGCTIETDPDLGYVSDAWNSTTVGGTQTWWVQGPSIYTGAVCDMTFSGTGVSGTSTLPEGTDKPVEPSTCPVGKIPGTVNGSTVCVTPGTDEPVVTESKDEKKVTNPDGSTTTTTTTTTTTCTGSGSCNTTTNVTVTNSPSGGGTGTTTSTVTAGTCTTSVGCGLGTDNSTAFGGSCSGNFTCSHEDATACAIAIAVNKTQCLMAGSSDIDARAAEIAAGTFSGTYGSANKSVGEFNQSNPFSSSCPADQTISVGGSSVVIPLSTMCDWLTAMGNVLVAFCLLGATIFVLKGFGGT